MKRDLQKFVRNYTLVGLLCASAVYNTGCMFADGIDDKNSSDFTRGVMDDVIGRRTMQNLFGPYRYENE